MILLHKNIVIEIQNRMTVRARLISSSYISFSTIFNRIIEFNTMAICRAISK